MSSFREKKATQPSPPLPADSEVPGLWTADWPGLELTSIFRIFGEPVVSWKGNIITLLYFVKLIME